MGTGEREGDREKIGGFARIFLLSFLSLRHFRCIEWALHWTLETSSYFEIGHRTFVMPGPLTLELNFVPSPEVVNFAGIFSPSTKIQGIPSFISTMQGDGLYMENGERTTDWGQGIGKESQKKSFVGRGEKTKVTEKLFNLNAKLYSSLFPSLFFSQSNKSWHSLLYRSPLF